MIFTKTSGHAEVSSAGGLVQLPDRLIHSSKEELLKDFSGDRR